MGMPQGSFGRLDRQGLALGSKGNRPWMPKVRAAPAAHPNARNAATGASQTAETHAPSLAPAMVRDYRAPLANTEPDAGESPGESLQSRFLEDRAAPGRQRCPDEPT